MGKLMTRLEKQLTTEYKEDAEDCIKIYRQIQKNNGTDHVWQSQWNPLVNIKWLGKYPYQAKYTPTTMGYTFLKGIKMNTNL